MKWGKLSGRPFYASAQARRHAKDHISEKWVMIREIPAASPPASNPHQDQARHINHVRRAVGDKCKLFRSQ